MQQRDVQQRRQKKKQIRILSYANFHKLKYFTVTLEVLFKHTHTLYSEVADNRTKAYYFELYRIFNFNC